MGVVRRCSSVLLLVVAVATWVAIGGVSGSSTADTSSGSTVESSSTGTADVLLSSSSTGVDIASSSTAATTAASSTTDGSSTADSTSTATLSSTASVASSTASAAASSTASVESSTASAVASSSSTSSVIASSSTAATIASSTATAAESSSTAAIAESSTATTASSTSSPISSSTTTTTSSTGTTTTVTGTGTGVGTGSTGSTGTVLSSTASDGGTIDNATNIIDSVAALELLYPSHVNGSVINLCTDPVMLHFPVPSGYAQRTGNPPVCVIFWGLLQYPIIYTFPNGTELLVAPARPDFELFKVIFYPEMDTFSLLELASSTQYFAIQYVAIQIPGLARSDFVTLTRGVDDISVTGYVVPFVTMIFQMTDGIPVAAAWDDGCFACTSQECISERFCGAYNADYQNLIGSGLDLKVYIGWFGTDKDGKYLTSADKRFSQFRRYSVNQLYQSASTTAANASPSFPSFPIDNFK